MLPPPSQPEVPPPAPTVCVCGYDLSGLPADAAAKCPECGAVIAELVPTVPWYMRGWIISVAFVSPTVFIMLLFSVLELLPSAWFPKDFELIGWGIILGLIVIVSTPACCVYMYREFPSMPAWKRFFLMIFAVPLSLITNLLMVGLFVWVVGWY